MSKYADPKIDLMFKRIFGEHPHLLKSLLNALLPLNDDALIESLEYLSPEQVPEVPGLGRRSIVDVKCRDVRGRTFIVEMQMLWTEGFKQRVLFGASQAFVSQVKPGQSYTELQEVYALALINARFDASDAYYHHYKVVRVNTPSGTQDVIKGLQMVFVELPKFKAEALSNWSTAERRQLRQLWLRFLREVDERAQLQGDDEMFANPDISEALRISELGAMSEQQLASYRASVDDARTELTLYHGAHREGMEEGLQIGMEKGMEKGEHRRALLIAQKLLAQGLTIAQVAALTELGEHEITALR